MLKVGITGGIGSGKSIVCKIFSSLQVPVYYADQQAKILIETDPEIRTQIISQFGEKSYTGSKYNHRFIAGEVFTNRDLLYRLNKIIHPAVENDFYTWAKEYDVPYIIEEAAVLFESGADRAMDHVIVIDAPEKLRISRIKARDGLQTDEIIARVQNQWSADKLRTLADWIIINDDKVLVLPQILQLHKLLLEKSKL